MEKLEQESRIRKMARLDGDSAFDVAQFKSVPELTHWLRRESVIENNRRRIREEIDLSKDAIDTIGVNILDYFQLYYEYHHLGWFEAHLQNEETGHYSREPQIQTDTTDYDKDMTKPELPATPIDAYYEKVLKTKVDFQEVLRNLRESTKHIETAIDGLDDELKKIRKVKEIESE